MLNATINLYAYCTIEEIDGNFIEISAYDVNCNQLIPSEKHLFLDGQASLIKGVYNRIVKDFDLKPLSFKITTYNDAPAGSGLGTSSTMIVAIIKCFVEWLSLPLGDYEISRLAYEIERIDLGLSGGKQDQYAATFGGYNFMEFLKNDIVIVNPLKVKRWIMDELEASMLLYFTGKSRSYAQIIDEQKKNASQGNQDAIQAMRRIKQSALEMKLAVLKGDMKSFAKILGKGWDDKKKMASSVNNPMIKEAFDVAISAGAVAGKVSGAGGGGFIMFVVSPTCKKKVINALSEPKGFLIPFQFTVGSTWLENIRN